MMLSSRCTHENGIKLEVAPGKNFTPKSYKSTLRDNKSVSLSKNFRFLTVLIEAIENGLKTNKSNIFVFTHLVLTIRQKN